MRRDYLERSWPMSAPPKWLKSMKIWILRKKSASSRLKRTTDSELTLTKPSTASKRMKRSTRMRWNSTLHTWKMSRRRLRALWKSVSWRVSKKYKTTRRSSSTPVVTCSLWVTKSEDSWISLIKWKKKSLTVDASSKATKKRLRQGRLRSTC